MSTAVATSRRGILPAELPPEAVVATVGTREQLPLDLAPLQTVAGWVGGQQHSPRLPRSGDGEPSDGFAPDEAGHPTAAR
jgi:hypothetical protein